MKQRTYEKLAGLPLRVESYALESLGRAVSSGFERHSTVVRLCGADCEGRGEDVTYEAVDQLAFQGWSRELPLTGTFTLEEFSVALDSLDLFPAPPVQKASRNYRRWAVESAALDLALRQAGVALVDVLRIEPRPVRFVVSLGLGRSPSVAPLRRLLEPYPDLRFKLDSSPSWTEALIGELARLGRVDVVDFKGAYSGTIVDQPADLALYTTVADTLDRVWLEDPAVSAETESFIERHRERVTWDAPIHSVADIEALARPPRMLNMKPSRFGSVSSLFDAYDHCRARGIGMYGGGQFELGPGRGQIQYLAALFHPSAPNDVAPGGYNISPLASNLPTTPLDPAPDRLGFAWVAPARCET